MSDIVWGGAVEPASGTSDPILSPGDSLECSPMFHVNHDFPATPARRKSARWMPIHRGFHAASPPLSGRLRRRSSTTRSCSLRRSVQPAQRLHYGENASDGPTRVPVTRGNASRDSGMEQAAIVQCCMSTFIG